MTITTTSYHIEDIKDWEEFVNNLFNGLKSYEKKNPDFKFKITTDKDTVTLKVVKMNESVN